MSMFRNAALLAGVMAAALPVAIAQADETVNLFTWQDYFDPAIFADFEKETGIHVQEGAFESSEGMMTKLLVGGSGYDVVVASEALIPALVKAGIIADLDTSKLPNIANQDEKIAAILEKADAGNAHAMAYTWGTTGIAYNIDAIKQRLGNEFKIDSWGALFDPAIAAKLKDCGIYLLDSPQTVYPVALRYLGKDGNSRDPADIAAAEKLLLAVRPYVTTFTSVAYVSALANNEACIAMGWSGDVVRASQEAEKAGNGVKLAYVVPKEGSTMWIDNFVMPSDAPNADNAHKLIDFLMRPDIAARNSNYLQYPNGNSASLPLIDAAMRDNPNLYPPADVYQRLFTVVMFDKDPLRQLNKSWTTVKTAQ